MRSSSVGRKSSINPVRISQFERTDKPATSSEPRASNLTKPKAQPSNDSQIPRARIRSLSLDRGSIRRSKLKSVSGVGKTPGNGGYHQSTTPKTPQVNSNFIVSDLPSGARGRSPSAERASGLMGNNVPKKDTRSLNDKNFQTEMLMRIDNFFRNANQTSLLNPSGSLKPISLKIFVSVTDFLLKCLDVKLQLNSNNYMDELPKIAKKLQYPGTITKSWLKTANTMHAWPHVLGWLSWLVEICEVNDYAHDKFQLRTIPMISLNHSNDEETIINRNQLIKLQQMYKAWNEGDEQKVLLLQDEYVENIANECSFRDEDQIAAEQELDKTQKKYDEIDKVDQEYQAEIDYRLKKLEALKLEKRKQEMYIEEQEKFVNKSNMDIQNLNKELALLEKSKQKLLKEHEALNADIEQQLITPEECDAIMKKCQDIENHNNQLDIHIDELQKEIWTDDLKHSHIKEKLRKAIFAYNRDTVINFPLEANDLQLPETSLTDLDFKNHLNEKLEAIKKLKEVLKKQLNNYKIEINTNINKLETLQEEQKIQEQNRNAWLSKNDEKKLTIQNIKLSMKEEEQKLLSTINKLKNDISYERQQIPDLEKLNNEVIESQDKLEAVERRKEFLERQAERVFSRLYSLIKYDIEEMHKIAERLKN